MPGAVLGGVARSLLTDADTGLGQWTLKDFMSTIRTGRHMGRGRPVLPGETVDLGKLIGACCTLVISHQQNMVGKTYASIDAVSKPTRKVAPSGLPSTSAGNTFWARTSKMSPSPGRA